MEANRLDGGQGPQIPNAQKFPDGMAAVVKYVKSKGLKLGEVYFYVWSLELSVT
jgi:hypothetical protein